LRVEEHVARLAASLKLQIILGMALMIGLFTASTLHSMHVIDAQRSDDQFLRLAEHLQLLEQQLTVQAMQYEKNAPRDYPSYYRDLNLYYASLQRTRADLDAIIQAFDSGDFSRVPEARQVAMLPPLSPPVRGAAAELASEWRTFSSGLDERLGPDLDEPRLEWAAQWIVARHDPLAEAAQRLATALEQEVEARSQRAGLVSRLLLGLALIGALLIAVWFFRRIVHPLTIAVEGFNQVANGDFSQRVPVVRDDEIGSMAQSFNHLATRLDTLRRLLTGIAQGADLDETLSTLSETLPGLLPVDWIGVVIRSADGRFHLEQVYSDGRKAGLVHMAFDPEHTLLTECIERRRPLHIPDLDETARTSPHYVFLRALAGQGRRDAVFLPIGYGSNTAGVAVFANRVANSYGPEHLALMDNLGVLIGISLARTWHMVENTRLAHIGQFASGIVHEIRNPLATIGLALDHLAGLGELPPASQRRLSLALGETGRLERLLTDILAYAKPTTLERTTVVIDTLLGQVTAGLDDARIALDLGDCGTIQADMDRLRQVILNLLRNALDATPADGKVTVRCRCETGLLRLMVHNTGAPIGDRALSQLFEPFFTTKPQGTGLGLAIVRRIVETHGGRITVASDSGGTTFTVTLPAVTPADDPEVRIVGS
jgi:signal transduction histidine kinase